jgi:hypothetical protein
MLSLMVLAAEPVAALYTDVAAESGIETASALRTEVSLAAR